MENLPKVSSRFTVHSSRSRRILFLSSFALLFFLLFLLVCLKSAFAFNPEVLGEYCQESQDFITAGVWEEPINHPVPVFVEPNWYELDPGTPRVIVNDPQTITDTADAGGLIGGSIILSQLKLPFAKDVADYLEGKFQDESHRMQDLSRLSRAQLKSYSGPVILLQTQRMIDEVRKSYIEEIYDIDLDRSVSPPETKLQEAIFEYADICGRYPQTIYSLVENWGRPEPPSLLDSPADSDWELWRKTWERYWLKIPIVKNYRSQGCISIFVSDDGSENEECDEPYINPEEKQSQVIKIGVPDAYRLNKLSEVTQRLLLPGELIEKNISCNSLTEAERVINDCPPSSKFGFPQGPRGFGGEDIYIYTQSGIKVDRGSVLALGQTTAGEDVEANTQISSKFPYFGLIWERLAGAFFGAIKSFDPKELLQEDEYQKDSVRIPAQAGFIDVTGAGSGTISDIPVWAGFLGGVEEARNFIIKSLNPLEEETF